MKFVLSFGHSMLCPYKNSLFLRVALIICLLLLNGIDIQAQDLLQQAADAYELGDYVTAIGHYESAILNGEENGTIYYNLGNAYYQSGFLGHAMLNYRRAATYLPRDAELAAQIHRVQSERIDAASEDSGWLNISANLSAEFLTFYEMSIIVFILWLIFFTMLGFSIKNEFWEIPSRVIGTILLMVLLLLGSRFYVETQHPAAVVLSPETQVYSGPGEDYLSLFKIYEAAEIRVLGNRGDWLKFSLPDGQQGWILNEHVGYITIQFGINLG